MTSAKKPPEQVVHPPHYGGADDPFEAIKVITAWRLNFARGSVLKYLLRAGRKGTEADEIVDLKKAAFYLAHEIARLEGE